MTTVTVPATDLVAGLAAGLVLLLVWRAGARSARAKAAAARRGARLVSLAGRVLANAGMIVAVQWVVVTQSTNPWLLLAVLGLPALFASYALTRALTVTAVDAGRRRGGRR